MTDEEREDRPEDDTAGNMPRQRLAPADEPDDADDVEGSKKIRGLATEESELEEDAEGHMKR